MSQVSVTKDDSNETMSQVPFYVKDEPPNCVPWQTDVTYWDTLETIWGEKWGAQGIGKLKRALVSFADKYDADPIFATDLTYFGLRKLPDVAKCREEQQFAFDALKREGVKLDFLERPVREGSPWPGKLGPFGFPVRVMTSAATAFVVHGGAIVPRRGVTIKIGAEVLIARKLLELGCPILYTVTGTGVCEIGASDWLDFENWIYGVGGADNNMETVNQVTPILQRCGVKDIITASCGTGWGHSWGASASWAHVTNYFNVVDLGLAICYPNGVDYSFMSRVLAKGVDLIEVPEEEQRAGCINITLIEPGKIVMPVRSDKPPVRTLRALRAEGVDVIEVKWDHMAIMGGGLHCGIGALVRDMPGPSLGELGKRKGKIKGSGKTGKMPEVW
jgi:N-dimethylarginine dimethylaminohydrolase